MTAILKWWDAEEIDLVADVQTKNALQKRNEKKQYDPYSLPLNTSEQMQIVFNFHQGLYMLYQIACLQNEDFTRKVVYQLDHTMIRVLNMHYLVQIKVNTAVYMQKLVSREILPLDIIALKQLKGALWPDNMAIPGRNIFSVTKEKKKKKKNSEV